MVLGRRVPYKVPVLSCHADVPQSCEENAMAANALVQTRIDPVVKAGATVVLKELGMTVTDAVDADRE